MTPIILKGAKNQDNRGLLLYNNDFDFSEIKRIYTIENSSIEFIRAWQGHRIEQRWFSALNGSFQIKVIEPNDWQKPTAIKLNFEFILKKDTLDFLHIPAGYLSSIKALEEKSQLLVLADYKINEVQDDYKFELEVFKI